MKETRDKRQELGDRGNEQRDQNREHCILSLCSYISRMKKSSHALYITPLCGYCHWVISAIEQLRLDVEIRDITTNRDDLEDLYRARQRTTVPVLRISSEEEDQWMPESRDIVAYLKTLVT